MRVQDIDFDKMLLDYKSYENFLIYNIPKFRMKTNPIVTATGLEPRTI